MDIQKHLEFKNEITDMDKGKNFIMSVAKIIEAVNKTKTFEEYTQLLNEDKEGMFIYGIGAPKYTTLQYYLDIEVYDFLNRLGIDVMQQIHQVDDNNPQTTL